MGWVVSMLATPGCALERSPLVPMSLVDAPEPPTDVGTIDGGAPLDSGLDAPDRDVPPDCTDLDVHCEGDVLVTCVEGSFGRDDCAARNAYCDAQTCMPQVCMPSSVTCSGDVESRCDARGASSATSPCVRGCTDGMGCNPVPTCASGLGGTLSGEGTISLATCEEGDDSQPPAACTTSMLSGSDVVVRIEIAVGDTYRIEARAVGGNDPVLYLRTACDDPSTTLTCDDDAGPATRSSRIELRLEPGEYFAVVDSFRDGADGDGGRCGDVDLVVDRR